MKINAEVTQYGIRITGNHSKDCQSTRLITWNCINALIGTKKPSLEWVGFDNLLSTCVEIIPHDNFTATITVYGYYEGNPIIDEPFQFHYNSHLYDAYNPLNDPW